jgi:hypothetical protein
MTKQPCTHAGTTATKADPKSEAHEVVWCSTCGLERRRVRHIEPDMPNFAQQGAAIATDGAEASQMGSGAAEAPQVDIQNTPLSGSEGAT